MNSNKKKLFVITETPSDVSCVCFTCGCTFIAVVPSSLLYLLIGLTVMKEFGISRLLLYIPSKQKAQDL